MLSPVTTAPQQSMHCLVLGPLFPHLSKCNILPCSQSHPCCLLHTKSPSGNQPTCLSLCLAPNETESKVEGLVVGNEGLWDGCCSAPGNVLLFTPRMLSRAVGAGGVAAESQALEFSLWLVSEYRLNIDPN